MQTPLGFAHRRYQDRLDTLANVRDAGISVCSGGIIGLGEEEQDRVGLLQVGAQYPAGPPGPVRQASRAAAAHMRRAVQAYPLEDSENPKKPRSQRKASSKVGSAGTRADAADVQESGEPALPSTNLGPPRSCSSGP